VAALALLTALAWAYVLWRATDMDMGGMDMTGFRMNPAGMGIMARNGQDRRRSLSVAIRLIA